ncbi:hypothetical protein ASD8599_00628 [Ascidiaceihabitans donghaensis]|uniref:Uncharacterized protein n=1 Tax=Ascidiaceihabitans donghaensis TaxID=1510460 RepID=A0A2R8BA14_9RHOB|nr:hypothetical protein [Ascidiaceihabitans donghaensis]SPH19889.1 hypothetical protein ASD8599_00628 [Ascidiaceihabitans donghaensis]
MAALPTSALAEVCDKVRPQWVPGTPATAFAEMIALFGTPPSLVLLVATALVLRFRSKWGGLGITVAWAAWVSVVSMVGAGDALQQQATLEGCVGSPALFILVVAAICIATILYTSPRSTRL